MIELRRRSSLRVQNTASESDALWPLRYASTFISLRRTRPYRLPTHGFGGRVPTKGACWRRLGLIRI